MSDNKPDESLSFAKLREANLKRCEQAFHPLHEWSPTDWATAMAGECGEACNLVKKLRRLEGADRERDDPSEREALRLEVGWELADLIIYADLLAARLDLDLGQAVCLKFNVVSGRRGSDIRL